MTGDYGVDVFARRNGSKLARPAIADWPFGSAEVLAFDSADEFASVDQQRANPSISSGVVEGTGRPSRRGGPRRGTYMAPF